MQGPDRRRGGSHVLRTGPPLGPRRGSVSDGHGPAHARPGAGAGPLALPPRAAVAGAAGPDESRGGDVDPGPAAPSAEPSDRDGDGDGDGNGRAAERAKDARIARLEADVAAMERDFRRERNRLSQAESETAVFWQARYSALNRQFLDADAALRVLRAEADRRSAEREDLLQSWELLHRRLRERDDEVRSLKDFVSTSTRSDGQTSDDFGDAMAKLANGLQNWVIVHFRKARLGEHRVRTATVTCDTDATPPPARPDRHRRDPGRAGRAGPCLRRAAARGQDPRAAVGRVAHLGRRRLRRLLCRPLRRHHAPLPTDGAAPLLARCVVLAQNPHAPAAAERG